MAVSRPFSPAVRAVHVARPGRRARGFLIGALLGVLLVVLALVAFRVAYADRILPGVQAGGVDIGGLTRSEARYTLGSALGRLEDGAVRVHSGTGWATIPYSLVGRAVDYDGMLDRAAAVGRGGTGFEEAIAGLRQLMLQPVSVPTVVGFDQERLARELEAFADRGYRQPVDAAVISTRESLTRSPAVEGVKVDTSAVAPAITAALLDPATPASIELTADSVPVPPAISDADAIRAFAAAERISTKLVLTHGKQKWAIRPARIRMWISFTGQGASYAPQVDPSGVPAVVKRFAPDLHRAPTEARFLRTRSGGVFGVTASRLGRALDVKATAERVTAVLAARVEGSAADKAVKVKTMEVAPKLSTNEATKKAPLVLKMGTWTTYYTPSAHNGFAANISIPAHRLDGYVVQPGALFDFWNAIGEVSFRAGYRLGGAIIGGHTVEGRALAGGICATSTTLFNAAARAGLQIVTRSPHWYYITRYPLGLDATVSDSQSMRFRNDTKHPVLIKAYASPGTVRFEIWSVPNGRTVSWSRPSVSNVVQGYDTERKTSALKRGQRERIEWPVDGKDVSITRTVRNASGAVIHRDVFVSHYHRMVGVTLVGTG